MRDSSNRAVRVLVVDSDVVTANQICEALLSDGYDAEFSADPTLALDMARRRAPSVMIVDLQLPDCRGYEFVRSVQSEFPHHDIPVIYVSAPSQGTQALHESRESGGLYYLSKPIDLTVLVELVDKSLWMPHLVRRHIENAAHRTPKTPRVLSSDVYVG
jgi:DNA-binding response OmpR family regulator